MPRVARGPPRANVELRPFSLQTGEHLATLLPGIRVRDGAIPAGGVLYLPDAQWGVYALKKQ
jgi:hypothetical protein